MVHPRSDQTSLYKAEYITVLTRVPYDCLIILLEGALTMAHVVEQLGFCRCAYSALYQGKDQSMLRRTLSSAPAVASEAAKQQIFRSETLALLKLHIKPCIGCHRTGRLAVIPVPEFCLRAFLSHPIQSTARMTQPPHSILSSYVQATQLACPKGSFCLTQKGLVTLRFG